MPRYYVNSVAQANGDHEVHQELVCPTPALAHNRVPLGEHLNCRTAVDEARRLYRTANGCAFCAPTCHTR